MRKRIQVVFSEPSRCDPSQAQDCDINNIIKRYPEGTSPYLMSSPGSIDPMSLDFGDSTLLPDYQTALELIDKVEETFFSLPSNIRASFDNNPDVFVAQLSDEKYRSKFEQLKLIEKPLESKIPDTEVSPSETNVSNNVGNVNENVTK